MNCQEARKIVEYVLDRNLSGSVKRRLDLHLSRCKDCRTFFAAEQAEHQRWFKALNSPEVPCHSLPPDFADRLAAAVVANSAMRRSLFKRLPRWALIAASLALMAGFVFAAATVAEFDLPGFNRQSTEGDVKFEIEEIRDASPITEEGGQSMTMRRPAMTALSAALAAAPLTAAVADGGGYTSASYVQDGLIAQWDGIDNAGTGTHDASATVWKDLKGSCDMALTEKGHWVNGNALSVTGFGACGSGAAPEYKTIEVVYKMTISTGRILFTSGRAASNGKLSQMVGFSVISGNNLAGFFDGTGTAATRYVRVGFDANAVCSMSAIHENGSVSETYCNGVVDMYQKLDTNWGVVDGKVAVGARNGTTDTYTWTGEVFAIRLYSTALTKEQIAANLAVDAARFGVYEYKYLVSGDPVSATTAKSCAVAEATPSAAIEARSFTRYWSTGVALDTREVHLGTLLIIR